MAKVAVIGLGYVGITSAVGLAQLGHKVVGYDIDQKRTQSLSEGSPPIHEAGLGDALSSLSGSGACLFTSDYSSVENFAPEFFFICVPTPQDASGAANLTYVLSAAKQLSTIAPSDSIVVLKSTVPVGSGERVKQTIDRDDVHVATNPEFLREGSALHDFMKPDRIIAGAASKGVASRILELYSKISSVKIATTIESAELVKYSTNAYLAMRLSFVNDLAALCEKVGASAEDLLHGLGSDSRIGSSFLSPGPGWGGSCFPKDTRALLSVASDFGLSLPLVHASLESNEETMSRVVEKTKALAGGSLEGKTIGVWGLAFKANTDDIRESPAMSIVNRLLDRGSKVQAFDPVAIGPDREGFSQVSSAEQAADGADGLVVLTEWSEFAEVDPYAISNLMQGSAVLDFRRVLPSKKWESAFDQFSVVGGRS
jgi:UDPglucose 6-dehydrogenase